MPRVPNPVGTKKALGLARGLATRQHAARQRRSARSSSSSRPRRPTARGRQTAWARTGSPARTRLRSGSAQQPATRTQRWITRTVSLAWTSVSTRQAMARPEANGLPDILLGCWLSILGVVGFAANGASTLLHSSASFFVLGGWFVPLRWAPLRSTLAMALVALLLSQSTGAAPASNRDRAACTVAPRSQAELRSLTAQGLAAASTAASTPAEGSPAPMAETGEPADDATVAAVTETLRLLAACSNADDQAALAALFTDDAAAVLLAASAAAFVQATTDPAGTPTFDLDAATVEAFVAANATPSPGPRGEEMTITEVRQVVRLDQEQVTATVLLDFGSEGPSEYAILFREIDGRYLIDFGPAVINESPATPAASPAA